MPFRKVLPLKNFFTILLCCGAVSSVFYGLKSLVKLPDIAGFFILGGLNIAISIFVLIFFGLFDKKMLMSIIRRKQVA